MKLPRIKDIPKVIVYKNETFKIVFVKKFKDSDQVGEYDPSDKCIRILRGIGPKETFATFLHELIHLVEDVENIKISHKAVYKLEQSFLKLMLENL